MSQLFLSSDGTTHSNEWGGVPEDISNYSDWDIDNFKFIIHEIVLYAVSSLLKYECFNSVAYLLRQHYYIEGNSDYGRNAMVPFTIFSQHMTTLGYRNKRLQLNRPSIRSDLLIERSKISGFTGPQLMQADLVIFLRDAFKAMRSNTKQKWWPGTLLYLERFDGPLEVFARAQSIEYFNKLKNIFDIQSKGDFGLLFEAMNKDELQLFRLGFSFHAQEISELIGFKTMATLP